MNRIWRVFPLVLVLLVIVRLPAAAQIGPLPLASFTGTVRDIDGKGRRYQAGEPCDGGIENCAGRELEAINVRVEAQKAPSNNKTPENEK
jgi:hypothetical protein